MMEAEESQQELIRKHKNQVSGKFFNEADLNKYKSNSQGQAQVQKVTRQKIKNLKYGQEGQQFSNIFSDMYGVERKQKTASDFGKEWE